MSLVLEFWSSFLPPFWPIPQHEVLHDGFQVSSLFHIVLCKAGNADVYGLDRLNFRLEKRLFVSSSLVWDWPYDIVSKTLSKFW
jgi:hypothetical protein